MSDIQKAIDGLSRAMELTEVLGRAAMKNVWHPIETAPKDGTWLLLYIPEGIQERSYQAEKAPPFTIGYWSAGDYQAANWYSVEGYYEFYDYGGYTGAGCTDYLCQVQPTHWMPLPEPPRGDNG